MAQQQQQDTAVTIEHETLSAHHRAAGQAYFDSVVTKVQQGADPFAAEPPRKGSSTAAVEHMHPDVAAFGAALERHKGLLLSTALVVSQAFSWVLIKGALNSMHTPGVLAFLHLLAAAVLQLLLASWQIVEQPQISAKAAKGASVQAILTGMQVVLLSAFMLHGSVYTLLCWVTVLPLLIGYSRVADVNTKALVLPIPQNVRAPLALACVGLGIEMLGDHHLSALSLLMMCAWGMSVVSQHIWQQLKVDATLGHRIMNSEFLYRVRELCDLEEGCSPSTINLMAACLPALPALVLGLACLEGQDLVEHEPSVPTLSVLLLSCLAFAGACNLRVMLAHQLHVLPDLGGILTTAAAVLAIFLDFVERAHELGWPCLLGVSAATFGTMMAHMMRWKTTKQTQLRAL